MRPAHRLPPPALAEGTDKKGLCPASGRRGALRAGNLSPALRLSAFGEGHGPTNKRLWNKRELL